MLICAASNNAGKLKELRRILERMGHQVKSLRELGIDLAKIDPAAAAPPLSEEERRTLACLGHEPKSIEEASAGCGIPAAALAAVLMRQGAAGAAVYSAVKRRITPPGRRHILKEKPPPHAGRGRSR